MNNIKYTNKKTGTTEIVKVTQKAASILSLHSNKHLPKGASKRVANRLMLSAGFVRSVVRKGGAV